MPYYIWDPTFDALTAAGLRVLRYDLFGRGYSDRPNTAYCPDLFDRQLLELLEKLRIGNKVSLIGLSMGGAIAATFATQHPKQVDKLTLIDPAGFPLDRPWYFKLMLLPGAGELVLGLFGDGILLESMAGDFYDPGDVADFIDRYKEQIPYKGFKRALLSTMRNNMLDGFSETYRRVGELDLPVLLIWGREDRTIPFAHSQNLLVLLPQTEFHPIEKAGHIPHYERPEVVNPLLIEFLS